MNESELLRAFNESRSEAAFAQLVRRYADLVYSVARRRLANGSLAEDITQLVFIRLARTPPRVRSHAELAAWLHRTTVNVTIDLWRSETRRRARELQSAIMESSPPETAIWEQISPKLDEALNQLDDDDRQALLLRYFSQKAMRDVGAALGVSEDAARMRVSRALDRLRTQLSVSSVACTAAALGTMLAERSLEAAPVSLISRLVAIKLPAAASATGLAGLFNAILNIPKFKLAAGAVALALVAIVAVHLVRPVKPPLTATTVATAPHTNVSNDSTENEDDQRFEAFVRANQSQADSTSASSNINIHVLDMETGGPIVGARIFAHCFSRSLHTSTNINLYTDNSGTVVICRLGTPDEGIEMDAIAQGYVPKGIDPWGYHNRKIPSDYTIKLEPAMTVGGIVEDQDGQSVSGVLIVEQGPGTLGPSEQSILFQHVTNNSDGSWSYAYVPRYMTNQIHFILTKSGYATALIVVPVSQVNLNNLVFVMDKGFTISGRVTDAQQQPIPKACVKYLKFDYAFDPPFSPPRSVTTDENGSFTFSNVWVGNTQDIWQKRTTVTNENGEIDVIQYFSPTATLVTNENGTVALHESAGDDQPSATLEVQADGFVPQTNLVGLTDTTNVVNFTLSPGAILRGRVLDEAGNPVTNATVETRWGGGPPIYDFRVEWQTQTDAKGQFEWDSAPVGPTPFNFIADGYQWKIGVSLVADGSDHEITLKRSPPGTP